MDVRLISRVAICFVCFFQLSAYADNNSLIKIGVNTVNRSIADYSDVISVCENVRQDIDEEEIRELNIEKSDLKIALLYFHEKANIECSYKEGAHLVSSLYALESISNDKKIAAKDAAKLFIENIINYWELKKEYLKLSSDRRYALSKVEALNKPFNLIDLGKKLGL